jgi:hypothetical protein
MTQRPFRYWQRVFRSLILFLLLLLVVVLYLKLGGYSVQITQNPDNPASCELRVR